MRRFAFILTLGCAMALTAHAQKPPVFKWADLAQFMNRDDDTLYVLNFWATWCKPCVAELPAFERLQAERGKEMVKVVLISMDFRNQYDSHLVPFIARKRLQSQVVLLDEPKYNEWIDKLDPSWSGAIPATLFVQHRRGVWVFHEGEFSYEELSSQVNDLLSK